MLLHIPASVQTRMVKVVVYARNIVAEHVIGREKLDVVRQSNSVAFPATNRTIQKSVCRTPPPAGSDRVNLLSSVHAFKAGQP